MYNIMHRVFVYIYIYFEYVYVCVILFNCLA